MQHSTPTVNRSVKLLWFFISQCKVNWVDDMLNADRYHRYAGECRALAEQLSSEEHRRKLLDIAQAWDMLAERSAHRALADQSSTAHWLRAAFHLSGDRL